MNYYETVNMADAASPEQQKMVDLSPEERREKAKRLVAQALQQAGEGEHEEH